MSKAALLHVTGGSAPFSCGHPWSYERDSESPLPCLPAGQKAHPSAGAEPLSVLLAAAPEGPEASSNGTLDNNTTAAQGGEAVDGSKDSSKRLAVDGSRYVVVRAELALLRLLQDYAFFQETVPTLSVEVAHRVVELVKVCAISCSDTLVCLKEAC